jgi:hypothetical protein
MTESNDMLISSGLHILDKYQRLLDGQVRSLLPYEPCTGFNNLIFVNFGSDALVLLGVTKPRRMMG